LPNSINSNHNWAYAIIFITVGAAWYQKSAVSRIIAVVQAFMLPVTASGSVNTIIMTYITIIIAVIWAVVVLIERKTDKMFLKDRLQKRSWLWINMHTLIIAWLLIAHMGLVFLIGRAPMEAQLRYLKGKREAQDDFIDLISSIKKIRMTAYEAETLKARLISLSHQEALQLLAEMGIPPDTAERIIQLAKK